ncbi:MAG: DHHA1 domain-containing protein [Nanoarchaeota archaeon]
MLTNKQIKEIREHLEKAQNPLFFFDNDNDGLTSFLLLRRYIERGKGIVVKGSHHLSESYFKRVNELKPDYIFVLDIPNVEISFLEKCKEANLPVIWIDHHNVEGTTNKGVHYYNPYHNDKTNEPVSYLCYKISNRKQDIWIAMIGCFSDYYLPDFTEEFSKKYPELTITKIKTPFDLFYKSEIGKIAQMLDFSLKDTTTNVVNMLRFMVEVKEPTDILEENSKTKRIFQRYEQVNKKYQILIEKAREPVEGKLLYFQYGGDMSMSSNLANQLKHEFQDKFVVVVYIKEGSANISVRGNDARKIVLETIDGIDGATGGGHENACGAKIPSSATELFRERIEKKVK